MYESKAECRFLRLLGGDAVGMSTIPEVVASHHCNMKTLVLSLMTNKVIMTGDEGAPVATHDEVLQAVAQRTTQMEALVTHLVATLRDDVLPHLQSLTPVTLSLQPQAKREYAMYRRQTSLIDTDRLAVAAMAEQEQRQKMRRFLLWTSLAAAAVATATALATSSILKAKRS